MTLLRSYGDVFSMYGIVIVSVINEISVIFNNFALNRLSVVLNFKFNYNADRPDRPSWKN